jgi:uncharacterized protein YkwD
MLKILIHLFWPHSSNNYKAKALQVSSLSTLILLIMAGQILITFLGQAVPGVLGIATSITAEELINLTNVKRSEVGLPALAVNPVLSQAAQAKAADMIAKNYWAHTSPDGVTPWVWFKNAGYRYLYAGENLARDFSDSQGVINAWMNSSTHRENILSNRYREIGIAVVHDTFQGQPTTLIVQLFGTPVNGTAAVVQQQASKTVGKTVGEITAAAETIIAELEPPLVPVIDSFSLTKAVSLSVTILLLVVMMIDAVIITRKRIIRLSGNAWAHLVFLGILLLVIIGIQPGLIL